MDHYEEKETLKQYLLFHYGSDEEVMPYPFGPRDALHFPVRCVTECLDFSLLPPHATALDIGCAVGRSTFELSRYCEKVIGVDISSSFIHAAQQIQKELPEGVHPERVEFRCCDAMEFKEGRYDVVLVANLICRLREPKAFLANLHTLAKGQLIILSPYSWQPEYTPPGNEVEGLEGLKKILGKHFRLHKTFDLPFLIKHTPRHYEWGVSEASVWVTIS